MSSRRLLLALLLIGLIPVRLGAQTQASASRPPLVVPPGAAAAPGFDPLRATDAYLATMPADARARSDASFEGGYWIQLWGTLYTSAALWLVLSLGWSAAMRDRAARLTRFPSLRVAAYWVQLATVIA